MTQLKNQLGESWYNILEEELKLPYFTQLLNNLRSEFSLYKCYPSPSKIFRALQLTNPSNIKAVIIGQDCYFHGDHADGLAFSSQQEEIPFSLRMIFREIDRDVVKTKDLKEFKELFPTNDLASWAKQGVLLLNTSLTVRAGQPNSHADIGWNHFVKSILKILVNDNQRKVFMLWGKDAREITKDLSFQPNHKVLEAGHPATASHGKDLFSGCSHFSKANYYFWRNNVEEINWTTK